MSTQNTYRIKYLHKGSMDDLCFEFWYWPSIKGGHPAGDIPRLAMWQMKSAVPRPMGYFVNLILGVMSITKHWVFHIAILEKERKSWVCHIAILENTKK